MNLTKLAMALAVLLVLGSPIACQKQLIQRPDVVIGRYIAAYNAHDEGALRAVVADGAQYVGTTSGNERPLIEQCVDSWRNPATADARLATGSLAGQSVIVVWTQPRLSDGTTSPWIPGAYLAVDVVQDRIAGVRGTLILDDRDTQAKVVSEPPTR